MSHELKFFFRENMFQTGLVKALKLEFNFSLLRKIRKVVPKDLILLNYTSEIFFVMSMFG